MFRAPPPKFSSAARWQRHNSPGTDSCCLGCYARAGSLACCFCSFFVIFSRRMPRTRSASWQHHPTPAPPRSGEVLGCAARGHRPRSAGRDKMNARNGLRRERWGTTAMRCIGRIIFCVAYRIPSLFGPKLPCHSRTQLYERGSTLGPFLGSNDRP